LYWITAFNDFYKLRPTLILPLASGLSSDRIMQLAIPNIWKKSNH
jgi:hypothetical protein